jgi:hypothetical protein
MPRIAIGPGQGHDESNKYQSDSGNDDGSFCRHGGPRFCDLKKLRAAAISALTWIKALSITMELTGRGHVNVPRNSLTHFVMERM